jgi:polyisoprenoid-binding protein YceI
MTTINVSDIPEHETIPRTNLTDHLKGVDFFDVGHFPTATFEITTIKKKIPDSLKVSGNLTIKGITKTITFDALYTDAIFSTTFIIDRFQWNIAYEGSLIDKTLVDKDIELTIRLKT